MYKLIFYTRYGNRFVPYMQWLCFFSRAPSANGSREEKKKKKTKWEMHGGVQDVIAGVGDKENRRISSGQSC